MPKSRSRSRSKSRRQRGRGYGSISGTLLGSAPLKQKGGVSGCAYKAKPDGGNRRQSGGFGGCPGHKKDGRSQRGGFGGCPGHKKDGRSQRGGFGGNHSHKKDPRRRYSRKSRRTQKRKRVVVDCNGSPCARRR